YVQTRAALAQAQKEKQAAIDAAERERAQNVRAEDHLMKTVIGMSRLVARLRSSEWSGVPEMASARRALIGRMEDFFLEKVRERNDDDALRRDTNIAYQWIALCYFTEGDFARAEKALLAGLALLEERPAGDEQGHLSWMRELHMSYYRLEWHYWYTGRRREASDAFRRSLELSRTCFEVGTDLD